MVIAAALVTALTAVLWATLASDDSSHYLVFSTWGTPSEIADFQRLIDTYNATRRPAHPVKLSHSEQYQYVERLLVGAAAGSVPDVIHLDRGNLPLFVQKGMLEDLGGYVGHDSAFSLSDFLPSLVPSCTVGGRMFGLPHNFSTLVLYYNRDHFDAAGLRYPDSTWTWDSLVTAARRLTRYGPDGSIVRYGCHLHIINSTLIAQNGGRILNEQLDSCVVASPEAAGAIQFSVDLSEKYRVSWSMLAQNLQWDDMMAGGKLSMIANGRWAAAGYMRSLPAGVVNVAPLPRGRFRRGAATLHVMCMAAGSGKKEEAWEFMKYLVSPDAQKIVNDDGASIPVLSSVAWSDAFLHHHATPQMANRVFLDELPRSVPWPFEQGPYLSTFALQSQTEEAVRRVLLGRATVMESLRLMQDELNREIRAQRAVPVAARFAGSVALFVCCVLLAAAGVAAWWSVRRVSVRRKSTLARRGIGPPTPEGS
jgi:multiple sugar transport system substrate-binding protein